jgi:hypothetical protein
VTFTGHLARTALDHLARWRRLRRERDYGS